MEIRRIFLGSVMMASTLLFLCGCSTLNEKKLNNVESLLEDKYGIDFEVSSIGGRYGTGGSGTVQTYVYPKNDETLHFKALITKDGELKDDYIPRLISEDIDRVIKREVKEQGIELKTSTSMLYLTNSDKNETNLDIKLDEYVEKYSPENITTSVVVKEGTEITATLFQPVMEKIYSGIKNAEYSVDIFVLSSEDYEKFLEKPSALSFFGGSDLSEYKILNEYSLYMNEDGFKDYTSLSNKNK